MKKSQSRPLLTRIGEIVMQIDKYGESASFNIAGKSSYPSVYGTLISILILFVVIPCGVNKFFVMRDYEDTNFQSIIIENKVSPYKEVGYEQSNLNVMLLFTKHDGAPVTKADLEGYIELDARMFSSSKKPSDFDGSFEF